MMEKDMIETPIIDWSGFGRQWKDGKFKIERGKAKDGIMEIEINTGIDGILKYNNAICFTGR